MSLELVEIPCPTCGEILTAENFDRHTKRVYKGKAGECCGKCSGEPACYVGLKCKPHCGCSH